MGIIQLKDLFDGEAGEHAVEIGAMPVTLGASAMWLAPKSPTDPVLVYKREIPVYARFVPRVLESGDVRHRWWRLEIKVHREDWPGDARLRNLREGRAGLECVVAAHPYSTNWYATAAFRRSLHRDAPFVPDNLGSFSQLATFLDSLENDYWEKGDYLTAGFEGWAEDPRRSMSQSASWVVGACDDAATCGQVLADAPEVAELLEMTARDVIRYQMSGVDRAPLNPEVIEERQAHMLLAINQALAGPHEEGESWIGADVVNKVDHIYRSHLNAHNRRLSS